MVFFHFLKTLFRVVYTVQKLHSLYRLIENVVWLEVVFLSFQPFFRAHSKTMEKSSRNDTIYRKRDFCEISFSHDCKNNATIETRIFFKYQNRFVESFENTRSLLKTYKDDKGKRNCFVLGVRKYEIKVHFTLCTF